MQTSESAVTVYDVVRRWDPISDVLIENYISGAAVFRLKYSVFMRGSRNIQYPAARFAEAHMLNIESRLIEFWKAMSDEQKELLRDAGLSPEAISSRISYSSVDEAD